MPFAPRSNAEIAQMLVTLGVELQIAASTVRRWLAAKIKPWRYLSWQHILEPKIFLERVPDPGALLTGKTVVGRKDVGCVHRREDLDLGARSPRQPILGYKNIQFTSRISTNERRLEVSLAERVCRLVPQHQSH